jgi:FixJ family two-component response regulator
VLLIEDNPADAQLPRRALEAGANFFVSKPYEAGAVLSAIDASISEKGNPVRT